MRGALIDSPKAVAIIVGVISHDDSTCPLKARPNGWMGTVETAAVVDRSWPRKAMHRRGRACRLAAAPKEELDRSCFWTELPRLKIADTPATCTVIMSRRTRRQISTLSQESWIPETRTSFSSNKYT
jgi:hypothetical protein